MEFSSKKPHVVCIPYPAQGHINPMMKLAKILLSNSFHVTFVNTIYNHNRLIRARGPETFSGLPSFRFETIPDGLPEGDPDVTQDTMELCRSIDRNFVGPFRALVARLNETASVEGSRVPHVTCIVSDAAMMFASEVAQEVGVPNVMLWSSSGAGFLGYSLYDKLLELGLVPLKDENYMTNGQLDMALDWVPGAKGIRLRDLPSFIRTTDPNDFLFYYVVRLVDNLKKASGIFINTFNALENDAIQSFSPYFPPIYTIGPLELLLDSIGENESKSIRSNLWKEDSSCLDWLDTQKPKSVVYVNFGSITVMTNDQFVEFAWGLANSNKPFLWITRPDLVIGDSAILSPEFQVETKGRGLITSWCDQEQVLAHPVIGGFLTHNGWNSTLESIYNGVPMICWPFFADQQTNCWYCCNKWGVGMEIDTNVKRDEVTKQVMEIMEEEKGKEMKRKAMEWKRLAQEAVQPINGSSYSNLENAIKLLLSPKRN